MASSSGQTASNLVDVVLRSAEAWRCLDDAERREMYNAAEYCKLFLQRRLQRLVIGVGGLAIVASCDCDGPPLVILQMRSAHFGDVAVQRHGNSSAEFLTSRAFYKFFDANQEEHVLTQFSELVPLLQGKSGLETFTARRPYAKPLRSTGHLGIIIQHLAFGRAVLSVLDRKYRQLFEAQYSPGTMKNKPDPQ